MRSGQSAKAGILLGIWAAVGLAGSCDAQAVLLTVSGTTASESFGSEVFPIGDVDGDGFGDVAARSRDLSGPFATWWSSMRVISGADGATLWTAADVEPQALWALRVAGDLDGDGVADVIVARRVGGVPSVDAMSGVDGSILWSIPPTSPTSYGRFGVVDAGFDANGDGVPDAIISDFYAPPLSSYHLWQRVVSGATGSAIASWTHGQFILHQDRAATLIADRNGDGLAEVCRHTTAGPATFAVYASPTYASVFATVPALPNPVNATSTFGSEIGRIDDVDGDGDPDLSFARRFVPFFSGIPVPAPLTYVYSSQTLTPIFVLDSAFVHGAGSVARSVADYDMDGVVDLAIADSTATNGLSGWSVVSGATGAVLHSMSTPFGGRLVAGGAVDVYPDGTPDLLFADSENDAAAANAGFLAVLSVAAPPAAGLADLGGGCSLGAPPTLAATPPVLGAPATMFLSGAAPGAVMNFAFDAASPVATPLPSGCVFHLDLSRAGFWVLLPAVADAGGSVWFSFDVPRLPILAGATVVAQVVVFGAPGSLGVDLSNGLATTLGY
jgi:hypothetical protein